MVFALFALFACPPIRARGSDRGTVGYAGVAGTEQVRESGSGASDTRVHEGDGMPKRSPRPPKPNDRPSNIRLKKASLPSLDAALGAVSALTRIRPMPQHHAQFKKETESQRNHRGMAILLAAYVENTLQRAIIRNYRIKEGLEKDLFGPRRPLGDFSAKICVAQAMGIVGGPTGVEPTALGLERNLEVWARQAPLP